MHFKKKPPKNPTFVAQFSIETMCLLFSLIRKLKCRKLCNISVYFLMNSEGNFLHVYLSVYFCCVVDHFYHMLKLFMIYSELFLCIFTLLSCNDFDKY